MLGSAVTEAAWPPCVISRTARPLRFGVRLGDRATCEQLGPNTTVGVAAVSDLAMVATETWFADRSARQVLELSEQRMPLRDGVILQMLHAELRDEDESEDRDSVQRWRPRF